MTESNNEKRNYGRVPLGNEFLLRLNGEEYSGNTTDISPGGLRLVEIQPELPSDSLGQQGELFFHDPEEKAGVKCKIEYTGDSGIGVSFCEV